MRALTFATACWLSVACLPACSGEIDRNLGGSGDAGGSGAIRPDGGTGGTGIGSDAPGDAEMPPANPHARCGWIGPGNENDGVGSFVANASYFQVIHPVWYAIASDAVSINPVGTVDDPQVMSAAAANSVKVWPLVAGVGTPDDLRTMMATAQSRSAHIQKLVDLVTSHDYAGLEMDYEGLWTAADRAPYTAFVQELAAAIHAAGKQVSIAGPALTDNATTNAWDYQILVQSLDAIHLMGYDFHWAGGDHPGPVAPLAWVDAAAAFAAATGQPQKFILGMPNYGVGGGGGYCSGTECAARCGTSYDTTTTHMQVCPYGNWDPGRSPNCTVAGGPLYFDDIASLEQKVMAARAHGLGGITYWNLGKEPDGLLTMFRRYY